MAAAMIPNTPWLRTVQQFDDEAIASTVVRLAPAGRIDVDTLLRLHFDMENRSPSTIASKPDLIRELAALGSFDLQRLAAGAWRDFKDRTEFLGCELPSGWFDPARRRVAPARLAADGDDARIRNIWLLSAMRCDVDTGESLIDRCPACLNQLGWWKVRQVWACQSCNFDLRQADPAHAPPETFSAAKSLASYILDRKGQLPPSLDGLSCLDVLKLSAWLAYFRAIPERLFLNVSAQNAAEGFVQLKRWPASFDETVQELLGGPNIDDHLESDVISRSMAWIGWVRRNPEKSSSRASTSYWDSPTFRTKLFARSWSR
jgi:hypothetical protein